MALCLPLLAHAQVGRPDPANPETSAPAMPGHGGHPKHGGKQ